MTDIVQPNPKVAREKLYTRLREKGWTKLDYETFENNLTKDPEKREAFYQSLSDKKAYRKDYDTFQQQYFGDVIESPKKKDLGPVQEGQEPIDQPGPTLPALPSEQQTTVPDPGAGSTPPVEATTTTEQLPDLIDQVQEQEKSGDSIGYLGKVWNQVKNFTKQFQASMANYLASYQDDSSYYGAVANQLADQDQIRKDLIGFAQSQKADIDPNALEQDFFAAAEAAKNGDVTKLGEWATNTILQIGEQGVASALTGGTALFAQGIGDTYGDAIEKRIAKGESLDEALKNEDAQLSAQLFGLGMGILEKVGLDKVLGKIGMTSAASTIANKMRNTFSAALTEGVTEASQETLQEVGSSVGGGLSQEQVVDRLKSGDFWKQLANSALAGAVGGGSLRGASEVFTPSAKPAGPVQQPATQQQQAPVTEQPAAAPTQEETQPETTVEATEEVQPEPAPAPEPIKAKGNIGRRVDYQGEVGVMKVDDEGNVVVETRDKIYELTKDQEEDLREYGIKDIPSLAVSSDESGNVYVDINGEEFSHVSTNTNQDGEVTSITVKTQDGKTRTIRDKALALDADIEINKMPTIQQIESQGKERFEQVFEEEIQNIEVDESHINPVNNILDTNMTDTIQKALDKAPSKMNEQEKLQIQLWADDVIQRLEKIPQSEYRDNMIQNILEVYDTVSNFKISEHGKRKEKIALEARANAPVTSQRQTTPVVEENQPEVEQQPTETEVAEETRVQPQVQETPAPKVSEPAKPPKKKKEKKVKPKVSVRSPKAEGVKVQRGNNTYRVTNKAGRLVVTRNGREIPSHGRKGKRVRQNSTYERVKREYEKTVNYDQGGRAPSLQGEPAHPDQLNDHIAQHSNNPYEVLDAYMKEKEVPNEIDYKTEILAENIGQVNRESFVNNADENLINRSLAKSWIAPKAEGGAKIDTLAEELTQQFGIKITEQDIVDFIVENPNGMNLETERNRDTPSQKLLRDRFRTLTGLEPNARVYSIALEQQEKKYQIDLNDPKIINYLSQEYETQQEAERSYYQQFSEEENIPSSEKSSNGKSQTEASGRTEAEEIRQQVENNKSTGTNDIGITALSPTMRVMLDIPSKIVQFYRKYLRSRGYFPQSVFNEHIEKKGRMSAQAKQANRLASKLAAVARSTYGRNLEANLPIINEALRDENIRNTLPAEVRDAVVAMRNKVTQLSQAMIDEGVVSGNLHAVIENNLDTYLNRSYRIHDDKKFQESLKDDQNWARFIKPQVLNRARAFLRNHYQQQGHNYSSDQIDGILRNFLIRQSERTDVAGGNAGKVGRQNRGVLKHRKDIPVEIRQLMGEYIDPSVNFGKSVMKMAQVLENHRFLQAVRQDGLGRYLFDGQKPPDNKHVVQIAAEADQAMFPLNGLWTTPEIKEMFDTMEQYEFQGDGLLNKAIRGWLGVNGYVKMAKTVLNPTTHVRNFMGGGFFATLNGYWRGKHLGKATLATLNDQMGNSKKWNAYFDKLLDLSIVDSNVDYGFMKEAIEQANKYPDNFDAVTDGIIKRFTKRAGRAVQKAYQNEDNFWKMYAFENEKARYRKYFTNEAELEKYAAEIVRDVVPNYNMLGKATQKAKYLPFTGSFLSFPAEIIRTTSNAVRVTVNDFKEGRTGPAVERGAGILFTSLVTGIVTNTLMHANGIDDEEDEAVRRFVAPWDKDAHLMYSTSIEDGKVRFVNFSYTDPYSYLKDPVRLMFKGATGKRDLRDSAINTLQALASPFLSEEILVEKILDVRSNKKSNSGAPIYNPEDDLQQQVMDIYDYVGEAAEPGVFRSLRRIHLAQIGKPNEYGRVYNLQDEIQSVTLGLRPVTIDVRQSLGFKFRRLNNRLSDARAIYTSVRNSRGEVTKKEVDEAYERANRIYKKVLDEYRKDVEAAILLRVPDQEVFRIMKDNKVALKNIGYLMGKKDFVDLQQ